MRLIMLLVWLTAGCAVLNDAELQPFINEFHEAADKAGVSYYSYVIYTFSDELPDPINIGICYNMYIPYFLPSIVNIQRKWWNTHGDNGRMQLVSHEAAHCELNEEHTEDKTDLMFPYIVPNMDARVLLQRVLIRHKEQNNAH